MFNTNNSNKMSFSPAELSVVEQLARGYSEKEIAEKLNLSCHTVSSHLRNIRERNNIQKNTEVLILYVMYLSKKNGLAVLFVTVNICDYIQIHV